MRAIWATGASHRWELLWDNQLRRNQQQLRHLRLWHGLQNHDWGNRNHPILLLHAIRLSRRFQPSSRAGTRQRRELVRRNLLWGAKLWGAKWLRNGLQNRSEEHTS